MIESEGNFERSAALAVWNGNIGDGVSALQRGAEYFRTKTEEDGCKTASENKQYAETLDLVAMCK